MFSAGGDGTYSARAGVWPVRVAASASSNTSSPRPPASTTPHSASTPSCSGVLSSAVTAASAAASTVPAKSSPASAQSSARAAAACSTDTIVPGTSSPIEPTTSTTPCRSPAPSSTASTSASWFSVSAAAEAVTSARPRRICDKITPELPRAPRSAPRARAATTCDTSPDLLACRSASANAARIVNSMFVPVSASATGNTFSRLISSACTTSPPTAAWAQSSRPDASNRRPDMTPPRPLRA